MKYVVYYRVSTKKQGDSGLGLDAQKGIINHYYSDKEIIAEFTDIASAKDLKRDELSKALELCELQNATLVIAKVDRLSRKTEDALKIYADLEGRLESCDIPNLDKFTLTLFMAIADRERELIGIRTKQALIKKKEKEGEWRKGNKELSKKGISQLGADIRKQNAIDNKTNKKATLTIVSLRKEGKSYREIAECLNNAEYRTVKGKRFQAVTVKRLYDRYTEVNGVKALNEDSILVV